MVLGVATEEAELGNNHFSQTRTLVEKRVFLFVEKWYNIFMFSKKNLIKFFSVLIVVSVSTFIFFKTQTYPQRITIDNKVFDVEVVDNVVLMNKGLSGHKPLSDTQGMLFVFERPADNKFWMKDMTFSIDIIWFDVDKKIIYIEKGAKPESYPKIFGPNADSLYVLEINTGLADKLGLKIGDQFSFVKSNGIKLGY